MLNLVFGRWYAPGSPARMAGTFWVILSLFLAGGVVHAQKADEEPFSFRADEELFQLEEAVSLVAASLNQIADQVSILAINSVRYGHDIDNDFRQKARVIFLEQLLEANPAIKLVQCQECERLETKIVRGVLRLRKGIPSGEARKELAEKLGVHGFIDIGLFREGRQLTVYIQVVEAQTGAIILVEEVTGRRAPKRESLAFGIGEMIFPIKVGSSSTDHLALILSVREGAQLTTDLSFGIELVLYLDNNANNPDPHIDLDSGLILAPTLGYDVLQFPSSASRLIIYGGLGKLVAPQLNYANLYKLGVMFIVGDELEVQIGVNIFPKSNLEDSDGQSVISEGTGTEIRFGYRF